MKLAKKEIEKSLEIGKIIFHEDQMKLSINRLNQMVNETIEEINVEAKDNSIVVGKNMVFISSSYRKLAFYLDLDEEGFESNISDSFNKMNWSWDDQDFLSLIEKIKFIKETKTFLDDYKSHKYFNQK